MELDDAYANAAYIPDADGYITRWKSDAAAFRDRTMGEVDLSYGEGPRHKLDLFHPQRLAKGLVVFVHGGYWLRFDKSYWSHLAQGALDQGWTVAMPSYDLCPDVSITEIGQQIAAAIAFAAARVPGPIRLVGHSAGGQLVARMGTPMTGARWQDRVKKIIPISPVADLAPLMQTSMQSKLMIDGDEVLRESPIHLRPPTAPVTVWVGADERPAFLSQARGLADAWNCKLVVDDGRHHFDVIAGLAENESNLTRDLLGD